MPSAARSAVAPAYLLACLILGGSAQGAWQNMVLQLGGVGLIAWAAVARPDEGMPQRARILMLLVSVGVLICLLQLVPLPVGIWAHAARGRVANDLHALGIHPTAMPLSLAPYDGLTALFTLIPPIALFCTVVRLRAYRPSWLALALIAGTLCGIMLGALQVASAGPTSPWYWYPITNRGLAVGFFANANHMADLLVITLPFVAAIGAAGKSCNVQRYSALLMLLAGLMLILIAGIALNRSLAGYVLSVPVLAASLLILLRRAGCLRVAVAAGAGLTVIAAAILLATSSIGGSRIGDDAASATQTRAQILVVTDEAIRDYLPMGSGLGTFLKVYRLYESPDTVTTEYVIHAHNDYAELALELGIPGVLLILAFLGWWGSASLSVWRGDAASHYARAASIASAAILVHSLVDFPLRTAALGAAFAMCLSLLLEKRAPPPQDPGDLRPTRHLVIR